MIIKASACVIALCLILNVQNKAFAYDGVVSPIGASDPGTNQCVSVKIVTKKDDPFLPQSMVICKPYSDFIVSSGATARVDVDCKICIENNSRWNYEFGLQYCLTGYYCLELDMMLDDGVVVGIKKRSPKFLSDNGLSITLKPGQKWECLVSLDRRLWIVPSVMYKNKIVKIRPRFAFGTYNVEGIYYRTFDEIDRRQKEERPCNDRYGELTGEWVDFNVEPEEPGVSDPSGGV